MSSEGPQGQGRSCHERQLKCSSICLHNLPIRCKCFNQTTPGSQGGWEASAPCRCEGAGWAAGQRTGQANAAPTSPDRADSVQCGNNQSFWLTRVNFGLSLWSLHAQLHPRPSHCQGRVFQAGSAEALSQPCCHQQQWCGVLGWDREG